MKGTLLSPHTVNVIELQSNKKVATPTFLHQPLPFPGLSPLPPPPQMTQFSESPRGGPTMRNQSFILLCKTSEWFLYKMQHYNQLHNISRPFEVLANFPFMTSETMRDYYL